MRMRNHTYAQQYKADRVFESLTTLPVLLSTALKNDLDGCSLAFSRSSQVKVLLKKLNIS